MTAGGFYRVAAAAAGPCETGKLMEVIEPYLTFAIDRHADERLALDFSLRVLPGAFVSSQWLSGAAVSRRKKHATMDGNDDLCLLVPRGGGTIQMRFPDRRHGLDDVVLHAGGYAQLWGNEESYHSWSLGSDNQVICVPRAEVSNSVNDLDDALYRGVPQSAALNLLCGYAKTLASNIGPLDKGTLLQARKTLTDLFILALGPTRDAAEVAKDSARAAQFARIKADIEENLDNPDLSLGWLARRHGRRPRAIRDLFYAFGTNFTDHVLATKLGRANKMLSDPRLCELTITAIAFRAGFSDLSWFNQAFRRRYGMTPSDQRRISQEKHSASTIR